MMVLVALVGLVLLLISLAGHHMRISPISITLLVLCFIMLGLANIADNFLWVNYALSVFCFLLGYYMTLIFVGHPWKAVSVRAETRNITTLWLLSSTVIGLVIYHFTVGGIPVLTEDVEVSRFHFSSSGLLGIPGRMYLFGLPLLLVLVSMQRYRSTRCRSLEVLYKFVWLMFIISRLLSGFKSAVLEIVILAIFVRALCGCPLSMYGIKDVCKYAVGMGVAILFALCVALQYSSLGMEGLRDSALFIGQRMTSIPAQPVEFVLENEVMLRALSGGWLGWYENEVMYFVQKYTGVSLMQDAFPLDKVVSAAIYSIPLSNDVFIVPVTVGAFAEAVANAGLAGALSAMFIVGAFYCWCTVRAVRSRSVLVSSIYGFMVIMAHGYMTKGGLIYSVINGFAVFVLFLILYEVAHVGSSLLTSKSAFDVSFGWGSRECVKAR